MLFFKGDIIVGRWWLLFIVVGLVSLNAYHTIQKKSGFFIDETTTFQNANEVRHANYDLIGKIEAKIKSFKRGQSDTSKPNSPVNLYEGVFHHEEEFRKLYIDESESGFNYYNIVLNQTLNDSHPPLYHFVLHTICSIVRSDNLIMIGFFVNIVLLIITCLFVYMIVYELFNLYWLALLAICYYGFSNAFLGNVIFTRMYAMSTMFLVMLLYLYLCLDSRKYNTKRLMTLICFVQFGALFTHYYSFLFISIAFAIILCHLKDDSYMMKVWVQNNVVMMIVFVCVWPPLFLHIYRGSMLNMNTASIPYMDRINGAIATLIHNLFSGSFVLYLIWFFIFVLCSILYYRKHKIIGLKNIFIEFIKSKWSIIIIPSLIYFYCVAIISPWVSERYEFPVFPCLSIIVIAIIWKTFYGLIENRFLRNLTVCILPIISLPMWPWSNSYLSMLNEMTEKKQTYINQTSALKAIVIGNEHNWAYRDVILNYYHPSYRVTDNTKLRRFLTENESSEKYVLYAIKGLQQDSIRSIIKGLDYHLGDYNYSTDFFNVYSLSKNNCYNNKSKE